MKDQHVNKIHLAGHSFGGRIALLLAYKFPELIKTLSLIAPVIKVNKAEGFLNYIPNNLLNWIFEQLFKGNNIINLGITLSKLGLVSKADLNYLQKQYEENTSKELLKYYAKSIAHLKITDSMIKKVFDNTEVNLYLSKTDPYSDYNYWIGLVDGRPNVRVLNLSGGHFGKIE